MYIRPTIQAELYRQEIPGTAAIIFKAAQYVIPALGYRIDGSDPKAGTITTSAVEMTLGQGDCDCGTAMGLPVIKSKGTKAKVYFILGVSNNELTIKAEIVPELDELTSVLGSAANIVCVSKGGLEKAFAREFTQKAAGNIIKGLFK